MAKRAGRAEQLPLDEAAHRLLRNTKQRRGLLDAERKPNGAGVQTALRGVSIAFQNGHGRG